MTEAADELEALPQLKARYCRFLDTKDVESMAAGTGGADPMTAPPMNGVDSLVPEITLTRGAA